MSIFVMDNINVNRIILKYGEVFIVIKFGKL